MVGLVVAIGASGLALGMVLGGSGSDAAPGGPTATQRQPAVGTATAAPLVRVEATGAGATTLDPMAGVVLADGVHVAVVHHLLGDATTARVDCGDGYLDAVVAGSDAVADLALLRVGSGSCDPATAAPPAPAGTRVRLVRWDGAGKRWSRQVELTDTDAEAVRRNGSVAYGLVAASGATCADGLLVDGDGHVVGWVMGSPTTGPTPSPDGTGGTAGAGEGTVMAHPMAQLARMADTVLSAAGDAGDAVPHGWMGVRASTAPEDGARILAVDEGGPASVAGIGPGDVVRAVDAAPVGTLADLARLLDAAGPGTTVTLEVHRDGAVRSVAVTLAEFPA